MQCVLSARTAWRAGPSLFFLSPLLGSPILYAVQCTNKAAADQLQASLDGAVAPPGAAADSHANGDAPGRGNGAAGTPPPPLASSPLPPQPRSPGPPVSPGPGGPRSAADGTAAGPSGSGGPGPGPPRSPSHPAQTPPQGQGQGGSNGSANGGGAADGASGDNDGSGGGDGSGDPGAVNVFDRKICRASSDMYFHYYGMLQHQQNMLQDYTRTGTYYQAICGNPDDFRGHTVLDVGAGSGILSLFAAQAGARQVYAVEASGMARFARLLADSNPGLGSRITVINAKVEELRLPEKVDVLVSEPMGTLLVNERMLESYLYARDAFLKPGGKMFPQLGRIHAALFSDEVLYQEIATKSSFWLQPQFYGVDVTALHGAATEGYFGQVVVDAFDPSLLASSCATKPLDFGSIPEAELLDIDMPLQLVTGPLAPISIHGLACWFDVFFAGANVPVWLTTAPGMPTTHWFQLRCVLQQPLIVRQPNTQITGRLHLVAHARQSYDIHLTLTGPPLQPGGPPQTCTGKFDLKEPYYRQLTQYGAASVAAAAAGAGVAGGGVDAATTGGAVGGPGGTAWGWWGQGQGQV
ncbi:hypothetical protein HYH03_018529 [Edaphochlamys debaryana]|uniref:type I protein arginine methyltransferase n=1 Tax=Edaphochlamys debaryana TaxID=47281 RepID=A0A835XEF4_9CHLO|nr:hypothetical protein HYH03_018529 [Edaphochlamys debaryana]|eukprot:KAG2482538.1 hypothetical protein HYH03_018529 [Edaphochlamys debaryana]